MKEANRDECDYYQNGFCMNAPNFDDTGKLIGAFPCENYKDCQYLKFKQVKNKLELISKEISYAVKYCDTDDKMLKKTILKIENILKERG